MDGAVFALVVSRYSIALLVGNPTYELSHHVLMERGRGRGRNEWVLSATG